MLNSRSFQGESISYWQQPSSTIGDRQVLRKLYRNQQTYPKDKLLQKERKYRWSEGLDWQDKQWGYFPKIIWSVLELSVLDDWDDPSKLAIHCDLPRPSLWRRLDGLHLPKAPSRWFLTRHRIKASGYWWHYIWKASKPWQQRSSVLGSGKLSESAAKGTWWHNWVYGSGSNEEN